MTPAEIWRVQKSFAQLTPLAEQIAERFYQNLLALDGSLKSMFRGDLTLLGRKFMRMLAGIVQSPVRLERVLLDLQNLARRHETYGMRPYHYATAGAALMITLEQSLGAEFTPEVRQAWAKMYDHVSGIMKDAAYASAPLRAAAG
jgi:hemoglobin-like flavoprotein